MHPNAYLRTFWQMEMRPEIFVAMSFEPRYNDRYEKVISPAIRSVRLGTQALKPIRVDLSKSGDSILTDIMDGIAHSQMVLADVSTVGNDKTTGAAYRSGNVMYEVGLALACRQPTEVLLIRDDTQPFLFDVSVIPHAKLDFTDTAAAAALLSELIVGRLRERQIIHDVRIQETLAAIGPEEAALIRSLLTSMGPDRVWSMGMTGNSTSLVALPRLLDAKIVRRLGKFADGSPAFAWTPLGYVAAKMSVESGPVFTADAPTPQAPNENTTDAATLAVQPEEASSPATNS